MSIADEAQVALVLADIANEDAAKKINMLGAGWYITGLGPTGFTPEQTIVVMIEVPSTYRGEQYAICLKLLDEAGAAVSFPGPSGEQTPLRIQQLVRVDPPIVAGTHIPPHVPSRNQILMRLPNGLPLSPNHVYRWVFEIDGNDLASCSFYVAGAPPSPLLG